MGQIDIQVAKQRLRVIGSHLDADPQQALDGGEREACRFLDVDALPDDGGAIYPDVVDGVLLLTKAAFEATTPQEIEGYRRAAETKLMPYRQGLGV